MRIIAICCVLFLFSCSAEKKRQLPYFNSPDFTPLFLSEQEAETKVDHKVSGFSFTNQFGQVITDADVKGKIFIVDFFFSRCASICPKMTNNMKKIAVAFARDGDVILLSHSVTPEYDSVAALKVFADKNNVVEPNWHLLTGDKEKIYSIARKGYFADERLGYSADTTEFLHTENFILVDKTGRIRGVYNGTLEVEVDNLIRHINLLKKEN